MANFQLIEELPVPPAEIPSGPLRDMLAYWERKRGDKPFALRRNIDPTEIPQLLGNIRLVDIEPDDVFRFRLYGSKSLNPDRRDMTGLTTRDYEDEGFGQLVTRHYATVAAGQEPRCWHIKASVDDGSYEYMRVVLPLSRSGTACDMLLVKSERVTNPFVLWR